MKNQTFFWVATVVLALMGLGLAGCSPIATTNSLWQQTRVSPAEPGQWRETALDDKETGLSYVITNDRENLYVLLQTSDPVTQRKMLMAGMELAIDTMGRRKGHCSIVFPEDEAPILGIGGMDRSQARLGREPGGLSEMLGRMIDSKSHMTLSGFKNHRNGRLPRLTEGGIGLALDLDTAGVLSYRAVIPLHTFSRNLEEGADPEGPFTLIVTVKGVDMSRMGAGPPRGVPDSRMPGRTPRGAPGRAPGGGMTDESGRTAAGGGRSAMPADMQQMTQSKTFRTGFVLAVPEN